MRAAGWKRWLRTIPFLRVVLILSFAINLAGFAALVEVVRGRGGFDYLKTLATRHPSYHSNWYYSFRTGMFEMSSVNPASRPIVFVGDSLTDYGNWQEAFSSNIPVLNRGIGGDTSAGVLNRIGQITALKPRAVFLMIGTNDRQQLGFSSADTARVYREIVLTIRRESPETLIYIQALFPSRSPKFVVWSKKTNRLIAGLADNRSVFFLDFQKSFVEDGLLANKLTSDGLHLSPEGYRLWTISLKPVMKDLLAVGAEERLAQ
jgi:lysophospholipase L1-like esterase